MIKRQMYEPVFWLWHPLNIRQLLGIETRASRVSIHACDLTFTVPQLQFDDEFRFAFVRNKLGGL